MTQVNSKNTTIDQFTYAPPLLPDYVAKAYTLKTIVGVPTDEEVKEIHNVIQALNGLSHSIPSLYDSKLATQLAQHLFTAQMAVYRNEYPSSVFPSENIYTPPSLPSQLPSSLEPVVGAPSDEELESAHKVVRAMENLTNNPLFEFDGALSVKLSQHLFNIQFARYIQDSNHGQFTQRALNTPSQTNRHEPSIITPDHTSPVEDHQTSRDVNTIEPSLGAPTLPQASLPGHTIPEPTSMPGLDNKTDGPSVSQQLEETNRLLSENEKLLRAIGKTLLSTHYNANRSTGNFSSYRTTNDKGELPWMCNLPSIDAIGNDSFVQRLTETELAGYLRFYGIGAELTEEETGNLKPEKRAEAEKVLARYLIKGRPSISHTA